MPREGESLPLRDPPEWGDFGIYECYSEYLCRRKYKHYSRYDRLFTQADIPTQTPSAMPFTGGCSACPHSVEPSSSIAQLDGPCIRRQTRTSGKNVDGRSPCKPKRKYCCGAKQSDSDSDADIGQENDFDIFEPENATELDKTPLRLISARPTDSTIGSKNCHFISPSRRKSRAVEDNNVAITPSDPTPILTLTKKEIIVKGKQFKSNMGPIRTSREKKTMAGNRKMCAPSGSRKSSLSLDESLPQQETVETEYTVGEQMGGEAYDGDDTVSTDESGTTIFYTPRSSFTDGQ